MWELRLDQAFLLSCPQNLKGWPKIVQLDLVVLSGFVRLLLFFKMFLTLVSMTAYFLTRFEHFVWAWSHQDPNVCYTHWYRLWHLKAVTQTNKTHMPCDIHSRIFGHTQNFAEHMLILAVRRSSPWAGPGNFRTKRYYKTHACNDLMCVC